MNMLQSSYIVSLQRKGRALQKVLHPTQTGNGKDFWKTQDLMSNAHTKALSELFHRGDSAHAQMWIKGVKKSYKRSNNIIARNALLTITCSKRTRKAFLLVCSYTSKCPKPLFFLLPFSFSLPRQYGQKQFGCPQVYYFSDNYNFTELWHTNYSVIALNSLLLPESTIMLSPRLLSSAVLIYENFCSLISSFLTSASFKTYKMWLQGQISHRYSTTFSGVIITVLIKPAVSQSSV